MGATDFVNDYRGPLGMAEAYREVVEQAFYDAGHDPYNGTISTTSGVMLDPAVKGPMTRDEVSEHLHPKDGPDWWDKDEQPSKWDAAWAIQLKPEPDYVDPYEGRFGTPDRHQPGWVFYGWAAC